MVSIFVGFGRVQDLSGHSDVAGCKPLTTRIETKRLASAAHSGLALGTGVSHATILGISFATVKQSIYKGKLRTVKTVGGHHRILVEDTPVESSRREP